MAGSDISVESVEVILLSEIERSSATMMKDAYLSLSGDGTFGETGITHGPPGSTPPAEKPAGPSARVVITRIVNRTPDDMVEQVRKEDPGGSTHDGKPAFYTVVFAIGITLGDPSTTRLVNGMIEFVFPEDAEIRSYSPKDKGSMTALIESGRNAFSLSPFLVFSSPDTTKIPRAAQKNRFTIPHGGGAVLSGSYTKKNGHSFDIPGESLLEYEGIVKNRHEIFWEFYPPMPPNDDRLSGTEMLAFFTLIIGTHRKTLPEVRSIIDCKVKGDLWGVVSLTGSADIP
jgi:hypothetical protein